jgi:hypothetical protein
MTIARAPRAVASRDARSVARLIRVRLYTRFSTEPERA